MFYLNENRHKLLRDWLPIIASGLTAWLLFVWVGQTPIVRATGMAVAILGIAATLRRMGAIQAFAGGLVLALSPVFWSQTGGASAYTPTTLALALAAAVGFSVFVIALSQRPYVVMAVTLAVFAALFFSQIGVTRSLRVSVIAGAWMIHLLYMAVLESNPRPDDPAPARLRAQYRAGLLLLLGVGVINDPLFVLFAPSVILGLAMSKTRIPLWYWVTLAILILLGLRGMIVEYYRPEWWQFSAERALERGITRPFLIAEAWRLPERWIDLFGLLTAQFTLIGILLGLVGLSRMARWYPTLGITLLVAWGTFFAFGLGYFGSDRAILLLPLVMIQVVWMTYAVYVLGQWLEKVLKPTARAPLRYATAALYLIMPAFLLLEILGAV